MPWMARIVRGAAGDDSHSGHTSAAEHGHGVASCLTVVVTVDQPALAVL